MVLADQKRRALANCYLCMSHFRCYLSFRTSSRQIFFHALINQNIMNNNVDGNDASVGLKLLTNIQIKEDYSFKNLYNLIIIHMGGMRTKPDTKKTTVSRQGYGLAYAVSQMCGWRLYMEDAHIATNLSDIKNQIFGIFDGHGGAEVSNFVARNFVKELEKNSNYKKKNYELSLKQTFLKMDELLLTSWGKSEILKIKKEMSQKLNGQKYQQQQSRAGSTANVCLITPEMIYVANVGDSRSIACNSKGQCIELSQDHKPQFQELMRIKKAGGKVVQGRINGKLNLSRSIGDFEYKDSRNLPIQQQMVIAVPDIVKIKNQGINYILMGCDGIWETKTNEQMIQRISSQIEKSKSLGIILQNLFDELICRDHISGQKGLDNMSAILIKFIRSKK